MDETSGAFGTQYESTYPGMLQKILVIEPAYNPGIAPEYQYGRGPRYYLGNPDAFDAQDITAFLEKYPNHTVRVDWMIVPLEGDDIDDNIPNPWGAMSAAQADFEDVNASRVEPDFIREVLNYMTKLIPEPDTREFGDLRQVTWPNQRWTVGADGCVYTIFLGD
jgi:hypothetical protein